MYSRFVVSTFCNENLKARVLSHKIRLISFWRLADLYTHYPFTQIREADPSNPQNSRHTTTLKVKTYDTLLY